MTAARSASHHKALRTMGHRVAHGVLFVRHRSLPVKDQEWGEMLVDLEQQLKPKQPLPCLIMTHDAGPNSAQRQQLHQIATAKGATLRVVVLSSSPLVRAMVTAFSWMGTMQIRSLEPDDYAGALACLRATHVSPADAARVFDEIGAEVG
jgi:hypothetical protein